MKAKKTITSQIIELAKRPEGVGSKDIPELRTDDMSARCCALVRQGILFRSNPGTRNVRYFANITHAQKRNADIEKEKQAVKINSLSRMTWDKNAKTVITSDTVVTICPSPSPRFRSVDLPHIYAANQRGRAQA